jgi:beta-glucanase (GH16 family)
MIRSSFRLFWPGLLGAVLLTQAACSSDGLTAPDRPESAARRVPGFALAPSSPFGSCDYDLDETKLAGWKKTFEDAFSVANDFSRWNIWTGGAWNEELEYYQASNLVLDGTSGLLAINARKQTVTGVTNPYDATPKTFTWTSGRIESKTSFSASRATPNVRMAARIKLPAGYGLWPAFWSYGDPWPTQGEIDILEARGDNAYQYQTNYFYGRRANVNLVQNAATLVTSGVSLMDCWHVYEVVWSQNALTFFLDGSAVDVKTGGYVPNLYGKKERLVLNLAVGGLFFSNLDVSKIVPGTLAVDWVKVFTR